MNSVQSSGRGSPSCSSGNGIKDEDNGEDGVDDEEAVWAASVATTAGAAALCFLLGLAASFTTGSDPNFSVSVSVSVSVSTIPFVATTPVVFVVVVESSISAGLGADRPTRWLMHEGTVMANRR